MLLLVMANCDEDASRSFSRRVLQYSLLIVEFGAPLHLLIMVVANHHKQNERESHRTKRILTSKGENVIFLEGLFIHTGGSANQSSAREAS